MQIVWNARERGVKLIRKAWIRTRTEKPTKEKAKTFPIRKPSVKAAVTKTEYV